MSFSLFVYLFSLNIFLNAVKTTLSSHVSLCSSALYLPLCLEIMTSVLQDEQDPIQNKSSNL